MSFLLLSTLESLKIPKPIIPFSIYFDCQSEIRIFASKEVYWSLGFPLYQVWNDFVGFTIVVFVLFQCVTIDEGDSDYRFSIIKLVVFY